jgi:hypothetical protein
MSISSNTPSTLGLPYNNVPLVDPNTGVINRNWWLFFNNLYIRVGGPNTLPLNQIEQKAFDPSPYFIDAYDDRGEELKLPGPQGLQGAQGVQGNTGPIMYIEPEEGDYLMIPGPQGAPANPGQTAYGEMVMSGNLTGTVCTLQNTFYPITAGWSAGDNNGFTFGTYSLTAATPGTFKTTCTMSVSCSTGSQVLDFAIYLNGSALPSHDAISRISNSNDVVTVCLNGIIQGVNIGDVFDVRVSNTTSAGATVTVQQANFSLMSVSGAPGTTGAQGPTGAATNCLVEDPLDIYAEAISAQYPLTGSNQRLNSLVVSAGAAATPSVSFDSSPTSGFYFTPTAVDVAINGAFAAGVTSTGINSTPIGATTASTGAFTTITATNTITPSTTKGIVGTTLGDAAQAGSVGEILTATGTGVSLTTITPANATSVVLTPGDWEVSGSVFFSPAGTTTTSAIAVGINSTSATFSGVGTLNSISGLSVPAGNSSHFSSPLVPVNITTNTTYYLIAQAAFAVSTMTCNSKIVARRVR